MSQCWTLIPHGGKDNTCQASARGVGTTETGSPRPLVRCRRSAAGPRIESAFSGARLTGVSLGFPAALWLLSYGFELGHIERKLR
jgi:hypothetical protein